VNARDSFPDHFSGHAGDYAQFRPTYPAALIDWLAELAPARALAWDCGAGSGQCARLLADRFARVVATDASEPQLARAKPHPKIEYRVALAHESTLPNGSVDLVTVAQALHWFDRPKFYDETKRVLKPRGVLAAWCYDRISVDPAVDRVIEWFYTERVGRFWPPERLHVERGYRDLEFPFEELEPPPFAMTAQMTREQLVGYIGTWSSVARAKKIEGRDPLPELREELAKTWQRAGDVREARWMLGLRVGRNAMAT
jgi:SAM-dependent methyltransferase